MRCRGCCVPLSRRERWAEITHGWFGHMMFSQRETIAISGLFQCISIGLGALSEME